LSHHNGERTQLAGFCSVSIERDADTAFIRLEGELDLACEDNFRAAVVSRMASWRPSTVIIDLRELTFIDSCGLRMLLWLGASAREEGFELTLVRADGQVRKVLRITRLDRLLPLERPLGALNESKS
jgi:anti-sigma B factor antagonist